MSRKVSVRIRYDRRSGLVGLLALALLVAALLGYLAWGQREAAASGPQAPFDSPRLRSGQAPRLRSRQAAQGRPLDHARDRPFDSPRLRSGQAAQDRPLASSAGLRGYYLTQGRYNGADADGTDGNGAGVCAEGYHFASLWEILDPSNLKYNTDLGYMLADSGQGPPSFFGGWVRTGYNSSTDNTAGQGNCNAWTSSDSGHRGTWAHLPDDWTAGGEDMHVWEVYTGLCHQSGYVWCVADSVSVPVYLPIILKNSS